jgi:integrase
VAPRRRACIIRTAPVLRSDASALDWNSVLAVAKENARAAGVLDWVDFIPGSAFDVEFGGPYDAVLLTNFLHHFDEATCVALLRKVRAALTRYAWVLLTLRTGLRLGEQMALQWGDIDWDGQFVLVQRNVVRGVLTSPKSHQCRRVDMSPQLTMAPKAWQRVQQARWLKKGQEMPPWLFPARQGGVLEERNVRHVFKRMLEQAELRQIRIHDLRHYSASRTITG